MSGARCVSFTAHRESGALAVLVEVAEDDPQLAVEMLADMRHDHVGRNRVYYFPSLQAPEGNMK